MSKAKLKMTKEALKEKEQLELSERLNPCYAYSSKQDKCTKKSFLALAKEFHNESTKDRYRRPICPNLSEFGLMGFRTAFKPEDKDYSERWFDGYVSSWGFGDKPSKKQLAEHLRIYEHRVFALLFMHEMHKDYLESTNLDVP